MTPVTIYTKSWCPFCQDAKALLSSKDVAFDEIPVDGKPEEQAKMAQRAGGKSSVPQIFIGDRHIGGCDDLYALDHAGRLDALLADAPASS